MYGDEFASMTSSSNPYAPLFGINDDDDDDDIPAWGESLLYHQ
jgi:hypothetical protein